MKNGNGMEWEKWVRQTRGKSTEFRAILGDVSIEEERARVVG